MTTNKHRWQVGDSGWEVEWCDQLAFYDDDPKGDVDIDRCRMRRRLFPSREDAWRFAVEVAYPQTVGVFGVVEITPFVIELDEPDYPRAGSHREYTADPEYYEGEE
jgi:hypothetical protein